jgi:rubrerythrin
MGEGEGRGERFFVGEKGGQNMLSTIPISLENVKKEDLDREICRAGIIAELDAINLYEQMAAVAKNNHIKKVLLDIAKEEKTHVGEFLTLLLGKDKEQGVELEKGKEEIEELIGK